MTDDLVKRLRSHAPFPEETWPLLDEAADEIERLQKRADYYLADSGAAWDRCEVLRKQRDELIALLKDAIESIEDWSSYASYYFQEKHKLADELAGFRAALANIEGEK